MLVRRGGVEVAGLGAGASGFGGKRETGILPVFLQQHWDQRAFCLFNENHVAILIHVNADVIPQLDLAGSNQVGEREHEISLDRPLEVTRAILGIGAFIEQKALYPRSAAKDKLAVASGL